MSELSEGKVAVKMEEKKHEHCEQFENWLSAHAKSHKSSVISTREYNAIKEYLLNGNQRQSESKVDCDDQQQAIHNPVIHIPPIHIVNEAIPVLPLSD